MSDDEAAIRGLVEERVEALRRKDAEAAAATLAADVVAFEMVGPLRLPAGQARDVAGTRAWLDSWDGPIETEVRDLFVHADGEAAFCHSLNRLSGTLKGGARVDMWMRSTLGLRKQGGAWRIVHAHTSVPFHADGSFRAATDLTPQP